MRTDPELVKGLLLQDYDILESPDLSPFITTASVLVDAVVGAAAENGITLAAALPELIERWLSAHCYQQSDQGFAEKRTDRSMAVYHGRTGEGLKGTKYGQMALVLDPTGTLKALDARRARLQLICLDTDLCDPYNLP